jgi:hypothetical protein
MVAVFSLTLLWLKIRGARFAKKDPQSAVRQFMKYWPRRSRDFGPDVEPSDVWVYLLDAAKQRFGDKDDFRKYIEARDIHKCYFDVDSLSLEACSDRIVRFGTQARTQHSKLTSHTVYGYLGKVGDRWYVAGWSISQAGKAEPISELNLCLPPNNKNWEIDEQDFRSVVQVLEKNGQKATRHLIEMSLWKLHVMPPRKEYSELERRLLRDTPRNRLTEVLKQMTSADVLKIKRVWTLKGDINGKEGWFKPGAEYQRYIS